MPKTLLKFLAFSRSFNTFSLSTSCVPFLPTLNRISSLYRTLSQAVYQISLSLSRLLVCIEICVFCLKRQVRCGGSFEVVRLPIRYRRLLSCNIQPFAPTHKKGQTKCSATQVLNHSSYIWSQLSTKWPVTQSTKILWSHRRQPPILIYMCGHFTKILLWYTGCP